VQIQQFSATCGGGYHARTYQLRRIAQRDLDPETLND
jgi:hypothetical protein